MRQGNLVVNEILDPEGTHMSDMQAVLVNFLTVIYPMTPILVAFCY